MDIPFNDKLKIVSAHGKGQALTITQILDLMTAGPEVKVDVTAVALGAVQIHVQHERTKRKLAKAQNDRTEAHRLAAVALKGMRDGYYRSVWQREQEYRKKAEADLRQANHSLGIYKQRAERAEATLSVLLPMLGLEDRAKEIADALLAKAMEATGL